VRTGKVTASVLSGAGLVLGTECFVPFQR